MPPTPPPVPAPPSDPILPLNAPTGPGTAQENIVDANSLQDFVSKNYFNYASYKDADNAGKQRVRTWMQDFFNIAGNVSQVYASIQNNTFDVDSAQARILNQLSDPNNKDILYDFLKDYVAAIDFSGQFNSRIFDEADKAAANHAAQDDNTKSKKSGESLFYLIANVYQPYLKNIKALQAAGTKVDPYDYIRDQINHMGLSIGKNYDFQPFFDHIDSGKPTRELLLRPEKFRKDTSPAPITSYQCRIGGSTFYVPPTNISVQQSFQSGSITNGALRQPNSPKSNLGHSEVAISMTIYFPNHETIWGFAGDKADFDIYNWDPNPTYRKDRAEVSGQKQAQTASSQPVSDTVIDRYLSSLRGLVTQFKYAPFLPVRNEYLNRTYDITAVTMSNMTVSTLPNYPFVLVVTLEMMKFNHKPFLPMIDDFDNAIHWGKFRQYMGRAAARLDSKVNQGFLVEQHLDPNAAKPGDKSTKNTTETVFEGDLLPTFDKLADIASGRNFEFYYPITTPGRIFAPDTTDFRQPGEDQVMTQELWGFILKDLGLDVVSPPQFNFFDYDRAYRGFKFRNERKLLFDFLHAGNIAWQLMKPDKMQEFIDKTVAKGYKDNSINKDNEATIREALKTEWFTTVYQLVIQDDAGFKQIKDSFAFKNSKYSIKEWNVPMEKLYIDWAQCIINNLSVTLSNNFVPLQIQLQDTPTYQHVGGGDSMIHVSMTIIGEDNLIRFRRLFDHINGLARLEKVHGVLGYLGIKNVVTSLCGIKYVLPQDFQVETVPNYPHVYNVALSFIDFDIMQQERESLSSSQQKELVDQFGKRNPFLRLKQSWSTFNAYPDFPLDLRDEDGKVVGHLDADWYFRSFKTTQTNNDIFSWGFDDNVLALVKNISEIQFALKDPEHNGIEAPGLLEQQAKYEKQLRELVKDGVRLPEGWSITSDNLVHVSDSPDPNPDNKQGLPKPELEINLGVYDQDQNQMAFFAFFEGGYVALGTKDRKDPNNPAKRKYVTGMASLSEDRASTNLNGAGASTNTTPLSEYQKEYIDGGLTANKQYESIMKDFEYRSMRGRMLRAFPTYMLWVIDEGGQFAGIKLFDNIYSLSSVVDFSVVQSDQPLSDTLVLRVSNIYQKLTTPYKNVIINEDDPLYSTATGQWISTLQNRNNNIISGLTDKIFEIDTVRLKPGVRLHLRMGYGSNPNSLKTVFNGVIAEIQTGDILTIIAQSDAVELSGMVNTVNQKGSSGNLDGNIGGFWLSEPRDLMVRLLTMGSSNFKEWLAWGSKGVLFSDSRFGIRHFGVIKYEPMSSEEVKGQAQVQGDAAKSYHEKIVTDQTGDFQGLLGDYGQKLTDITSISGLGNVFNGDLMKLGKMLWLNQFSKRDYEIFKRNIYPGNGSGIAQYMGGDQIDGGVTIATTTAWYGSQDPTSTHIFDFAQNQLLHPFDNRHSRGNPASGVLNSAVQGEGNKKIIDDILNQFHVSMTDEELKTIMASVSTSTPDLAIKDTTGSHDGLLETILGIGGDIFSGVGDVISGVDDTATSVITKLTGSSIIGNLTTGALELLAVPLSGGASLLPFLSKFTGLVSGVGRLADSGLGHVLGLNSGIADDDLKGFPEVSFRAQTYMKTVWDLFQVCSALLPNYIVAVRPFEDRSTVFYGKPHWLYTSGVVPITTGIPKDLSAAPNLDKQDQAQADIVGQARSSTAAEIQKMMATVDNAGALKDIMNFSADKNMDPNNVVGGTNHLAVSTQAMVDTFLKQLKDNNDVDKNMNQQILDAVSGLDLTVLTSDQLQGILIDAPKSTISLWRNYDELDGSDVKFHYPIIPHSNQSTDTQSYNEELKSYYQKFVDDAKQTLSQNIAQPDTKKLIEKFNSSQNLTTLFPVNSAAYNELVDFYKKDPVTFAYQFGWKFDEIPVWVDPTTGVGNDIIGSMTRALYNDKASGGTVKPWNHERSDNEAVDIWNDFRRGFRGNSSVRSVFDSHYPAPSPGSDHYDDFVDLFMRFLWQDPYNRAWLINVTDKVSVSLGDTALDVVTFGLSLGNYGSHVNNDWDFKHARNAWDVFLSSQDIKVNPNDNVVSSGTTRRWMEQHQFVGNDAKGFFEHKISGISNWLDTNVGGLLGVVSDTLTGFISTIRYSLMSMGHAVSMSGDQQRQANILNASLNDSIYYRAGEEGSLLRLVDNPFTREYGEPVIEIREPFQRVHFASSFDNIIDNKITENLTGVPTVVTAVSDGKYPVTVHFDKGISPERQVEKLVETGIYWDNVVGSGLFGLLQPLIHPLEALRGVRKNITGSSDELTARRIALWHLKEGLKNMYTGEIIMMGDADIRPHDFLYIADVYERMYGMVEVEQVIHHFTLETGFVSSVTPNTLVTINDPVRWSMVSYMWNKFTSYNIRDDVRAYMGIKSEQSLASAGQELAQEDIYKYFGTQINGSIQYTQGNSAIIRDVGAVATTGGLNALTAQDKELSKILEVDVVLGLSRAAGVAVGAGVGVLGAPVAGAAIAAGSWLVGDLVWDAWQWIKSNLLDQHGCFPAGTPVLTSNGYEAIENIRQGDQVFTHRNRYRNVLDTMIRDIDEEIYNIQIDRLGGVNLAPTKEHPFLVFKENDVKKYDNGVYKTQVELDTLEPSWVEARDLEVGDYIVIQGSRPTQNEDEITIDLAQYVLHPTRHFINDEYICPKNNHSKIIKRHLSINEDVMYMLGRYLGDGSIQHDKRLPRGIDFAFDDREINDIEKITKILANEVNIHPYIDKQNDGTHQFKLRFGCSPLAAWVKSEFGHLFNHKAIPEWAFGLSEKLRLALLSGLYDADGCDIVNENGMTFRLDVSNKKLAMGAFRMLRDLGAYPTFTGGRIQDTNMGHGTEKHYQVAVRSFDLMEFFKDKNYDASVRIRNRGFVKCGDYVAYRLKSIDKKSFKGKVYNFSVEEDESYIVDGVVSHNCYIQYLNKDGRPMDAGLSYAQGVAAGSNHSVSLFPTSLGLSGRVTVKEDGHYRITTNDLLGALGYSEVETLSLQRDASIFANQINTKILKIAGRDPTELPNIDFMTFYAQVLDTNGFELNDRGIAQPGVEDGDTIHIRIIDPGNSSHKAGEVITIRFSYVNAQELEYHDDKTTLYYNESDKVQANDLALLAKQYLVSRFSTPDSRFMAVRVDRRNELDKYGRTIGAMFATVPLGTPLSTRKDVLMAYANKNPPIPFDSYLSDGRPYTVNWEMIMTGYAQVDMRESLWDSNWRNSALTQGI